MDELLNRAPVPDAAGCGNLLNDAVRREIADLNLLYLSRALDPTEGCDESYGIPCLALAELAGASHEARIRAAHSPVALFELTLPPPVQVATAGDDASGRYVVDSPWVPTDARREARRAFGLVALGVAWRMGQGSPLTPRLVFGLGSTSAARLVACTPSELFVLASWQGLIRPRWAGHDGYWHALARAAQEPVGEPLQWIHRAGLCLVRQRPAAEGGPRRAPRAGHRRATSGKADVPC
jgi:hypothetical protein